MRGLPDLPHGLGTHLPGQAVLCLASSGCQLCWCLTDNPSTALLVQGNDILAILWAVFCAQLVVPCPSSPTCCFPWQVPLRHCQ